MSNIERRTRVDKDEEYISWRINTHNKYIVYKTSFGGKDYYKIYFKKKNQDGKEIKIYRNLKFVNCDPPEDKDIIRIKKAFEDNYIDPKNNYNDVCVLCVQEYEVFKDEEKMKQEAFQNFHRTIEENEDFEEENLPF